MNFDEDEEERNADLWLQYYNTSLRAQVKTLQESKASSDEKYVHKISALEMQVHVQQEELEKARRKISILEWELRKAKGEVKDEVSSQASAKVPPKLQLISTPGTLISAIKLTHFKDQMNHNQDSSQSETGEQFPRLISTLEKSIKRLGCTLAHDTIDNKSVIASSGEDVGREDGVDECQLGECNVDHGSVDDLLAERMNLGRTAECKAIRAAMSKLDKIVEELRQVVHNDTSEDAVSANANKLPTEGETLPAPGGHEK